MRWLKDGTGVSLCPESPCSGLVDFRLFGGGGGDSHLVG
jgi:hypothetical protein